MRGLRSTLAFIVVLAGLSAYIYFVTSKKPATDSAGPTREKVFAALQADKIDELRIKSESGETTAVKKNGSLDVRKARTRPLNTMMWSANLSSARILAGSGS